MNDEVNSTSESTDAEVPSTSGEQNIQEPTASSSEDVNTPEGDDLVAQAQAQVESPKAANRVQELANRARAAEAELQSLRATQQQQQSYQQPGQTYDPYAQVLQQQEQRLARMEEAYLFTDAERAYPELDRSSGKYNKDFDDLVFNTYRAEGITPKEAAAKVSKLIKIGQVKAEASLSEANQKKVAISSQSQKRSGQFYDDSATKNATDNFRHSGSTDDLARILAGKL